MPKVSVVIPVYNAQPYLRQCLDSIRDQTCRDIEVLCVNDGSTDDSLEVLREYAAADPRFIVLDKPNGGYGHSLNHGIARATGEFVSIIEPDDFIHPDMYRDLLSYADFGGEPADVVKGSYWEFFDGRDGFDNLIARPNLSVFMKPVPYAFKLEDDTTVICHHPSIWSAIYRRSFLEAQGIRFVEPKGAGWADNPFLFDTLVTAERIVWVPKGYYYYRQTNPSASSFLKDYHMPFDRLRDIHEVLRNRNAGEAVKAALYQRAFFYIESIIGEFGFDEADPELQSLIDEALSAMDPDIVRTHPDIPAKFIVFYDERMRLSRSRGEAEGGRSRPKAPTGDAPMITYLVPVGNDAEHAAAALESIAAQPIDSFEVLFVDCGCTDRSYDICRHAAQSDGRFRVVETHGATGTDAMNLAVGQARGIYLFVMGPGHRLRSTYLAQALLAAAECGVDVMLLDELNHFPVEALAASGRVEPYATVDDPDWPGIITYPFSPDAAAPFALNCSWPHHCLALLRTKLVREADMRFAWDGAASLRLFLAEALLHADTVAYASAAFLETEFPQPQAVPCALDIRDWNIQEKPLITPAAIELAHDERVMACFGQSVRNLVVDSFAYDLAQRRTEESIRSFSDEYLPRVDEALGGCEGIAWLHDGVAFEDYQVLKNRGLASYVTRRYLVRERDAEGASRALKELYDSRTFQIGKVAKEVMVRLLPRRALASIRSSIAGDNA